jgi:hypothetical protein
MKCKMEKKLYLFRDDELTSKERLQVEEHLQICAGCRTVWEQLHAMHQAIRPLRTITMPVRVNEAVLRRINEKHATTFWTPWLHDLERPRVRFALAFALILLLSALTWDQYDTQVQQNLLRHNIQVASAGSKEDQFDGCRDKVQRWYAGLQKNRDHFAQLWNYTAPVRLNQQQRHELTRMLQDCGLSDQHIRSIFNEYRI